MRTRAGTPRHGAHVGTSGVIGLLSPWSGPVAVMVLALNILATPPGLHQFSFPAFQNFAAYPFITVGSMQLLIALTSNNRQRKGFHLPLRITHAMAASMSIVAAAWAVVWLPAYPSTWLRVTPSGAQALQVARSLVPTNAEVVASQGIAGRFANRPAIYTISGTPSTVPVGGGKPVFFVLAPNQSIEIPVQQTESVMAQVATTLGAILLEHQAGIWVFRWQPPPGVQSVTLQGQQDTVPAWTLPSADGANAVTVGPAPQWRVTGSRRGYVIHGDYWFLVRGQYLARVTLSSTGPVSIEVWNSNTNTLLARRLLPQTTGIEQATIALTQSTPGSEHIPSGWGPFSMEAIPPPQGQPLEIRIYDPGASLVEVYDVGIAPSPATHN